MIRVPFEVEVEGVGKFTFRHKTVGLQIGIECEMAAATRGQAPEDKELRGWAYAWAQLLVLTETAPAAWDLLQMDPDDAETIPRVLLVHGRLVEEQARFRAEREAKRLPAGKAAQPNAGVPVPPTVSPAAH